MTPGEADGVGAGDAPAGAVPEARLPLREIDRALAPVRRAVRSALDRRQASPYLAATLTPHLAPLGALDLPEVLRDELAALSAGVAALPGVPDGAYADVMARLSRIDALAGLPLPFHPRPVAKVRQVDAPEPAPAPAAAPAPVAPPAPVAAPAPAAAPPVRPPPPTAVETSPPVDDEDEEDDGPVEFAGDLSTALADVVPTDLQPALAELAAHGFETVRDLAWFRPSRWERLAPVHGAGRDLPAGRVAVGGRVALSYTVFRPGGGRDRAALLVGAGPLRVRWAHGLARPPSPEGRNHPKVVLVGTVEDGALVDAEPAAADGASVQVANWDLPGVPDLALRELHRVFTPGYRQVRDPLAADAARRHGVAPLGEALESALVLGTDRGARRMAFDEALIVQLAAAMVRATRDAATGGDRGIAQTLLHGAAARLGSTDDLQLDDGAQVVLEDLKRDLRRNVPSRRVVTSEVGSGKGRLALLAAVMVAESKNQVLIVGADAADAEQRFQLAEPILKDAGYVARLLTTPSTPSQRDALRRGEVNVAFATPAIFDEALQVSASGEDRSGVVGFRRLGLMIVFERERFGVGGAAVARITGQRPHLLSVPVLPVGVRVLTTAYADHQVSVPVDLQRRPAQIALCGAEERLAAYVKLREVVDAGDQGVVVFPSVDDVDALDISDGLRLVRALEGDALRGVRVGLLHGAMPPHERAQVIEHLMHRRFGVVVSTARVEDLPVAPGVTMVVVEQADRMDQWRLHRVIGWLSRASKPATALLIVGDGAEPESAARIDRVVSAPDGFTLTEALVRLRGMERTVAPGSAPAPSWRWVDPDRDRLLVVAARDEAHRLSRADASLRRGGPSDWSSWLRRRWAELWPGADPAVWSCPVREEPVSEPKKKRRRRRRKR